MPSTTLTWAVFVALVAATSVRGGAIVELLVTDLGTMNEVTGSREGFSEVSGPFVPGEQVLIHVLVTPGSSLDVRGMQIDWRASSPELILGLDIDTGNLPLDGVPNFWFDYQGAGEFGTFPARGAWEAAPDQFPGRLFSSTGDYLDYSNLHTGDDDDLPWTPGTIFTGVPGLGQLHLDAGVARSIGAMPVTMPDTEGFYTVDLLNSSVLADATAGMFIAFGFGLDVEDPETLWSTAVDDDRVDDPIRYADGAGPVTLEVTPGPPTFILLAVGGLALRRRQNRA